MIVYDERFFDDLERAATTALLAGDAAETSRLASEMLAKNANPGTSYFGTVVHDANQLLGLAALLNDDVEAAKEYLRAAGRTPGSPILNSFGPDMYLAQQLLARGATDSVIEYLDVVAVFWADEKERDIPFTRHVVAANSADIAQWKAAILAGDQPILNGVDGSFPSVAPTGEMYNRVAEIEDVIAAIRFIGVSPAGQRHDISVKIGRPMQRGDHEIVCPCSIDGMLGFSGIHPFGGAGTIQALGSALGFPWAVLRNAIREGWKLYFTDSDDIRENDEVLSERLLDTCFGVWRP